MKKRQQRYWTGKAPEWAGQDDADDQTLVPVTTPAPPVNQALDSSGRGVEDARLLRLQQRQGQGPREGRGASEAVVVQRRRPPSPQPDDVAAGRSLQQGGGGSRVQQAAADAAEGEQQEEEEEEEEEAIAARRLAIRARQLAAAAAVAADDSEGDEGSEESSEYTSSDDEEDEHGQVMLKPAFVPKTERETLAEREIVLAQAEQTTKQDAEQLEDRRRQTQELVVQVQLQEVQQDVPMLDASDFDTGDEEEEEVAQYEAWRVRELQRIARDRNLRQAGNKAEAAAGAPASALAAAPSLASKKKWKFLQKYWHKGAFFQGEDEEGGESILGDVMHRDYDAPTGEDKFDRQILPKIMQVRNFGRRGRTKWQHLLAEDTSMQAADPALPITQPRQQPQGDGFNRPRVAKT